MNLLAANKRRADVLAASIRAANGLPPPATSVSATTARMSSTNTTATTTTTTTSSSGSTTNANSGRPKSSTGFERSDRGRQSDRVGSKRARDLPESVSVSPPPTKRRRQKVAPAPRIPKKKTSEIVLPQDWPRGYSPSRIDDMSPADVIALKRQQMDTEKEEKEFLPGSGNAKRDHKVPLIQFPAGEDDCRKRLHAARFLRRCLDHPKEWYGKLETKRVEIVRNIKLDIFGAENQVRMFPSLGWTNQMVNRIYHFSSISGCQHHYCSDA